MRQIRGSREGWFFTQGLHPIWTIRRSLPFKYYTVVNEYILLVWGRTKPGTGESTPAEILKPQHVRKPHLSHRKQQGHTVCGIWISERHKELRILPSQLGRARGKRQKYRSRVQGKHIKFLDVAGRAKELESFHIEGLYTRIYQRPSLPKWGIQEMRDTGTVPRLPPGIWSFNHPPNLT